MADSKDEGRAKIHPLPSSRRRDDTRPLAGRSLDAEQASSDPLLKALQRLAEDILDEPVPDRLRNALHKSPSENS